MADLPYIQQAQEVKITGQSSAGATVNFVGADAGGNMMVTDSAGGADGATAPAKTLQVGGKDSSGNLQSISVDTNGAISTMSRTPLTPIAATSASIGVASTAVVSANATRKGLIITNISANKISLNLLGGTAVLNVGITLYPGWIYEMDEYSFTTNAITGIASAAASVLSIQEFS